MDLMFNEARGRLRQRLIDGAALQVILLQAAEADDALSDHNTVDAMLAAAGNTEATFTNYARKTVANADVTVTVDDANNVTDIAIPNQTWVDAGGTTNNDLVKLVIALDGADDTARVPVGHYDFVVTTNGSDLTADFGAMVYRAN